MNAPVLVTVALLVAPPVIANTAVRVLTRGAGVCTAGVIRAEPRCDGCAEVREVRWRARDGVADIELNLAEAPEWLLQARGDGCWSASPVLSGSAEAATLTVWPAARITATLAVPRGEPPPDVLQLRLRGQEIADAAVDCAHLKERWSCEVPATELDVRIAAAGYIPHYLWGVRPEHGRSFDAGTLALRRGASIAGRAAVPARGEEGLITVTLAPDAVTDRPGTNIKTFTTTTNDRGFFQFAGFEPGAWTVTASKKGWSPAQTSVVISEAAETALPEALLLQPLARVELTFDPPRDLGGADWMVKLEHEPAWGVRLPVAQSTSSEGRWQSDPLEGGMYFITVTAADGAVVHRGGQMIAPGMPPLPIRINRVVVRGTVTIGQEPVAARLTFRDTAGKRVKMESDADGKFTGVISRDDAETWSVEVKPKDTASTVTVRDIDIHAVDGVADVSIALPDGRVSGKAVDESGLPVRASLRVYGKNTSADTMTAADGTFEIAGLSEGDVQLRARNAVGDSGFVKHTIHGPDDEPLTVFVPRKFKVNVTIETPSGRPYAGAMVRIITSGKVVTDEVSGPNGRVPVASPAQDPLAHVIVVAPGYPLMMRAVTLTGGDDTRRVTLPVASGKVFVPAQRDGWLRIGRQGMPAVILYSWLNPPPDMFRNRVEGGYLLDLEPGEYRFCADREERACVTRVVTPGSQQKVDFAPHAAEKEQP